jgi:PHD/YefM family antitoxin component YafN of YafNO toxin-antitoxin module
MYAIKEQYIIDKQGHKTSVLISIKDYQKILSDLEELEEIKAYDKAKERNEELVSFDEAMKILNL